MAVKKILIGFDIDGTLNVGTPAIARTKIVNVVKALYESDCVDIMLWSGGGKPYTEMWRKRLGLSDNIPCYSKLDPFAPRPDMAWDDGEFFNKADLVVLV